MKTAATAVPSARPGQRDDRQVPERIADQAHEVDRRRPVEPERDRQDEHARLPEHRNGEAEQADQSHGVIERGVLAAGRQHAERDTDRHGHEHGRERQLGGDLEPAQDHLHHGHARPPARSQVAAEHGAQPARVLHVDRGVESEEGAQRAHGLLAVGALRPDHLVHHGAGDEADHQEHGDADAEQRRHDRQRAQQHVASHGAAALPARSRRTLTCRARPCGTRSSWS